MRKLLNILKNIKSGAQPITEVPNFLLRAAKKNHLALWLAAFVAGVMFWRGRK
ncbi:MAG: hypothetical protein HY863_02265 [Chloroflexi bacterium]|nr:hypothetical protein [Chloroflexota bacterium]